MLAADAAKFARGIESAVRSSEALTVAAQSVHSLSEIFSTPEGEKLAGILQSLRVPEHERDTIIDELCEKISCSNEAKVTLQLLAEERLIHLLPEIGRQLDEMVDKAAGRIKVECRTAFALSDAIRTRLTEALSKILDCKAEIVEILDSSLMAGITLKAGNRIWDGSVEGRLARLAVDVVKAD